MGTIKEKGRSARLNGNAVRLNFIDNTNKNKKKILEATP